MSLTTEELLKPRYKVIAEIKSGMYSVCDQGFVINNRTGKRIKPCLNTNPKTKKKAYLYVKLQVEGKGRSFHIGALVGRAFVPNPKNKKTVNHYDGNKLNNHYTNIKWATYKENSNHAVAIGLIKSGSARHDAKLKDADVLQIRELFAKGKPLFEMAAQFNVSDTLIGNVVHNRTYKNVV